MEEHSSPSGQSVVLHATTVDYRGNGVLISGASGTGKSALALQLMALGATLVSDDRTLITRDGSKLIATAPKSIEGLIEARGVGLLQAVHTPSTSLHLAVDMGVTETERLPPLREFRHSFISLTCLYKVAAPYFPAAILQYLKQGRREER